MYQRSFYPALVGMVPFDAAKMRAFCEGLAPQPTPPAPQPQPAAVGSRVIDIRAELPFDAANLPWPVHAEKVSTTVHWPGGEFDVETDDDARNLLHAIAEEHIAKDWSAEIPGVQGGAGIMYAEAIAPSGTVFLMRDADAVLWHSNTPEGNLASRPILVICSSSHPPTSAQLVALAARITYHGDPARPHSSWTNTECPGDALRAFIASGMEDDMFTEEDRRKLTRVYDHLEAYEPQVWTKRLQQWLAKAIRSLWPNADTSGPDVESGQPFH